MKLRVGMILTTVEYRQLDEADLESAAMEGLAFEADLRNVERFTVYNPSEFIESLDLKGAQVGPYPIIKSSRDGNMLVMESAFGWGKEDQVHCTAVRVVRT